MKVYDVSKVYGVYDAQQAASVKRSQQAAAVSKKDKLSLSQDAVDFQAVMKGLKDAPDVREAKIAELTQQYEAGTYGADANDLAESLFKSGLFARKG